MSGGILGEKRRWPPPSFGGRYYIAYLSHLENTYLQHQSGLVGEIVFESYGWRSGLW